METLRKKHPSALISRSRDARPLVAEVRRSLLPTIASLAALVAVGCRSRDERPIVRDEPHVAAVATGVKKAVTEPSAAPTTEASIEPAIDQPQVKGEVAAVVAKPAGAVAMATSPPKVAPPPPPPPHLPIHTGGVPPPTSLHATGPTAVKPGELF